MHNAPSVSYPVGRPLFAGLLAASLWSAGVAASAYWAYDAAAAGWRQAAAGAALVLCGGWALLSWLRSARGDLRWDGAGWTAPGGAGVDVPEVALDLQQVLLVRWRAPHPRWIWLERRRCPQRWMDLRRAVYSRARQQALPAGGPPAAIP